MLLILFSISFHAVQAMKYNHDPTSAVRLAIDTIAQYYPEFSGAVVAVDKYGQYGAACHGIDEFPYSVASHNNYNVSVIYVKCTKL